MKKRIILLLVAAVLITASCAAFFTWNPIENEEQAISIAKSFVSKIYRKDLSEYEVYAKHEDGVWTVWYGLSPVFDENGELLVAYLGGGGPELRILEINGWVIFCSLQK